MDTENESRENERDCSNFEWTERKPEIDLSIYVSKKEEIFLYWSPFMTPDFNESERSSNISRSVKES